MKRLLAADWEYFISRNVPVWHDALALIRPERYHRLGVRPLIQARLHHGVHADFFLEKKSRHAYRHDLEAILSSPAKFSKLKRNYSLLSSVLLSAAQALMPSATSLSRFFKAYSDASPLLDLTTIANEIATDRVLEATRGRSDTEHLIANYAVPKQLAPFQRLQAAIVQIPKKYDLLHEAQKLQRGYAWIPVNFLSEAWGVSDFSKMLVGRKVIKPRPRQHTTHRQVPVEILRHLRLLGEIAHLNEYRKEVFSRTILLIRPVFDHLARSAGFDSWRNLSVLTHSEILDLSRGKTIDKRILSQREKLFLLYARSNNSVAVSDPVTAAKFKKRFLLTPGRSTTISGITAQSGVAQGTARIILGPQHFSTFHRGDILIAKMTSVDFIPIMRKAGGFVTDEGGLASHAAIIAREYHTPCVVGTKIATKVLRDGDRVEVDATHGTVRKLT